MSRNKFNLNFVGDVSHILFTSKGLKDEMASGFDCYGAMTIIPMDTISTDILLTGGQLFCYCITGNESGL